MKIWLFTIALFLIAAFFAAIVAPKSREGKEGVATAAVEFWDYQIYTVAPTGVESLLVGDQGRQYKDRSELDMPVLIRETMGANGNIKETLSAKTAVLRGDILQLEGNVDYRDTLGRILQSARAEYNRSSAILRGSEGFTLTTAEGKVTGKSFAADTKKREISAEEVKGNYYVKTN
ncbi:MAG: LPS export ABC transporter periplasmic protein LptC [Helicobacteraceae bacterium]|jgi:LPS export ABC transporter protein LptC|nr:LPS export ABC transporter periplasmic protein LptC [Helicobacteraceae bacterium]